MSISRKQFVHHSASILAGSLFARNKLFAGFNSEHHKKPLDCTFTHDSLKTGSYSYTTATRYYGRSSSNYIDAIYKED